MTEDRRELTGMEKASVLMMSLGAAASAKVFEKLSPEERELLGVQVSMLRRIDSGTRQRVLDEVNHALHAEISEPQGTEDDQAAAGSRTFLGALSGAAGRVRESVRGALSRGDVCHVEGMRLFSSPEEIADLPGSEIRKVIAAVAMEDLVVVVRVATEDLRTVVCGNLSPDERLVFQWKLDEPCQVRVSEIEDARQRIVDALIRLEVGGVIGGLPRIREVAVE